MDDNLPDGFDSLDNLPDKFKDLFKKLFKGVPPENGDNFIRNNVHSSLGEPSSTRIYYEDGMKIVEKTWHTEQGKIVSVDASPDTNNEAPKTNRRSRIDYSNIEDIDWEPFEPKKVSLEEQLEKAINREDYEKAAELRDKINASKEDISRFINSDSSDDIWKI